MTSLQDLKARVAKGKAEGQPKAGNALAALKQRVARHKGDQLPDPATFTAAIGRGVMESAAGIPEGIALSRYKGLERLKKAFDEIDAGGGLGTIDPQAIAAARAEGVGEYWAADEDTRKEMRARLEEQMKAGPQKGALYKAGTAIRESAKETFPIPPEHRHHFATKLGEGIGSTGVFLLTGAVGRVVKAPAAATVASTGAAVGASNMFREAVASGATFEEAYEAAGWSGIVGTSEALPIMRVLDTFDKATAGGVRKLIGKAVKGGIEEGSQELFQTVADNLIASEIVAFDPERGVFTGAAEAGGVGFTVGALFNTLAAMAGAKMRGTPDQVSQEFSEHIVREASGETRPTGGTPAVAGEPLTAPERPEGGVVSPEGTPPAPAPEPEPAPEAGPVSPEPPPTSAPAQPSPPTAAAPPASFQPGQAVTVTYDDGTTATGTYVRDDKGAPRVQLDDGPELTMRHGVTVEPVEPGVEATPAMTEGDFDRWFDSLDLGRLEDVRDEVRAHSVENGEGNWETVKATVEQYLDDPSQDQVWDDYREDRPKPAPKKPKKPRKPKKPPEPEPGPEITARPPDPNLAGALEGAPKGKLYTGKKPKIGMPTTNAALERKLDEADALRRDGRASPALRAAAERLQLDALDRLEDIYAQVMATDYGRAWQEEYDGFRKQKSGEYVDQYEKDRIETAHKRATRPSGIDKKGRPVGAPTTTPPRDIPFQIVTATGKSVTFQLKANPGAIRHMIKELSKKTAVTKFHMGAMSYGTEMAPGVEPAKTKKVNRSSLPDDIVETFERVADEQRGDSELLMTQVQHAMGGGVLSPVVERAGDIIHRMMHAGRHDYWAQDDVGSKVDTVLRRLTHPYGFEREMEENIRNNAKHRGQSAEALTKKLDDLLAKYANAHAALETFNEPQKLANELAVAVGKKQWNKARRKVRALENIVDLPADQYKAAVTAYKTDSQGRLLTTEGTPSKVHAQVLADQKKDKSTRAARATSKKGGPGRNYRGFIADTGFVGTAERAKRGKAKRREDILRPFLGSLGLQVFQGRIPRKSRMLGYYKRKLDTIRIKRMSDLEVTIHEAAHALDEHFPEIRKAYMQQKPADHRQEMKDISYEQSLVFEGFAEFVRHWATDPAYAEEKAPNFYKWFEAWVADSKHNKALRKIQRETQDWFKQNELDKMASKFGITKGINEAFHNWRDRFRQSVFDDLHYIYKMEKTLTGKIAATGAYVTARVARGRWSIIEGALLYGAPVVQEDGSTKFEGQSLQDILGQVEDRLDDFLLYAYGRSAKELQEQGRENLFTRSQIAAAMELENDLFDRVFVQYQRWNNKILDFAQAKQAIDPEMRKRWRRYQYMPMYRVNQPGGAHQGQIPGDWRGIKALTGGTSNVRDGLGNMIGNAAMLIDAAITNEVRLGVMRLSREAGGGKWMEPIAKAVQITNVDKGQVTDVIWKALGVNPRQAAQGNIPEELIPVAEELDEMADFVAFYTSKPPLPPNVMAVMVHGKPQYFEMETGLYRSMISLHRPQAKDIRKVLNLIRSFSQNTITLLPDFLAANIARDTLMGAVMSKFGFRYGVDSARGLVSRATTDETYKEAIANGIGFSSYLVDENTYRRHLDLFYRSKGINPNNVWNTLSRTLAGFQRAADAVEMSTRLGEYKRAREAGALPREAAYAGREVSTDFAMRGDNVAIGWFYDSVMFLKAAMNSLDRLYRGMAHDENKFSIWKKTSFIAAISIGLYLFNRGNPEYEDLEDWDKDAHWHIFIPTPETIQAWSAGQPLPDHKDRWIHFRYPKIWEIGAIGSISERSIERMLDNEPEEYAKDLARILATTFRYEWIPQAFLPVAEVYGFNENRYFERPIVTRGMEDLEPWRQFGSGTSRTMRALGEATKDLPPGAQISPVRAEALIRGYTNSFGMYGLAMADRLFFDDQPDIELDDVMVLRRFYSGRKKRTWQEEEVYKLAKEATMARRTLRDLVKDNAPKELLEQQADKLENRRYGLLSRAKRQMLVIGKNLRHVLRSENLEDLQAYTNKIASSPKRRAAMQEIRDSEAWNELGSLKLALKIYWTDERQGFAKEVVKRLEQIE